MALSYILIIASLLIILNIYPIALSRDLVFKSKQNSMLNQATIVTTSLSALDHLTRENVAQVMSLIEGMSYTRVTVTDATGRILYNTDDALVLGDYLEFDGVEAVFQGQDIFHSLYADDAFQSRVVAPVTTLSGLIGTVLIYENDTEQAELLSGMQRNLLQISAVIALVSLLVITIFSRTLTRRIEALLNAIKKVRAGDYGYRTEIQGTDEMAELAEEFNSLTDRLQSTEEIRRRFVSDASHELKTPLASIRLLSDSILHTQEMAPDVVREFVDDIGQEAERLARTTEKLLTLTKLDGNVESTQMQVDLKMVVGRAMRMLRPIAEHTGVTITTELQPNCQIYANEDDIYEVVFNLVENAIKYNVSGGQVKVSLFREYQYIILRVKDTGIGIPEADLPHIFDRFYRVDKARSREAGGSGLGLSIVKSTVQRYHGEITVESAKKTGTCFTVRFPEQDGSAADQAQ